MATDTKTVNIRIPSEMVEYLERKELGMNGAIVDCIERISYIEKYAMRDIKGVFTPAEWSFLADSLNGVLVDGDFRFASSVLIAHIEDSAMYEGTDKKWEIETKVLCEKMRSLSCSSIDAIYRRVDEFWKNSTQSLEEWSKY